MTSRQAAAKRPAGASVVFLHDDPEFSQLLRVAAAAARIDGEFVEKDYWVTHVLWWLAHEQFGVTFKGGTSLSKCFGIIHRFSEDIDVHLVPPTRLRAPMVHSWIPSDTAHAGERSTYFRWLARQLRHIPGIVGVRYDESRHSPRHINAAYYLEYDSTFRESGMLLHKSVQLEVAPDALYAVVPRHASSLVHDVLSSAQMAGYVRNQPETLLCAHPVATLLGKLDAICNHHARASDPSRYVRHFEDAHHIITAIPSLPPLPDGLTVQELANRMRADNQIRRSYNAQDDAFTLPDPLDRAALESAHASLQGWYWGQRVTLSDACATICGWLAHERLFADDRA